MAQANSRDEIWDYLQEHGGEAFPQPHIKKAIAEVEEFCNILRHEGVEVKRPDILDWSAPYETPDFKSSNHLFHIQFNYDYQVQY